MAVNLTEEQKRLLEQQRQQAQLPVAPMAPVDPRSLVGQQTPTQRPADYGYLGNLVYDYAQRALPTQAEISQQDPNQPIRNALVNTIMTGYRLHPLVNLGPQIRSFTEREFPEVAPVVSAVTQPPSVAGLRNVVSRIDQAIPNASDTLPEPAIPVAPPIEAGPALRAPDQAGNQNYNVTTTPDGVQFENALSSGSISGLSPEQIARVSAGLREANINTNVVPSSFFTGGAQAQFADAPVQRRLSDEEVSQQYERSRLEDVLNRPLGASLSPGQLISEVVNRRTAQRRYDQLNRIGEARQLAEDQFGYQSALQAGQVQASTAAQNQRADLEFRRNLALEQLKQAQPDWKSDTTKILDPDTGAETLVTTLSDSQGRSYQVPDVEDLAALRALPNDQARISMLRRAGVPDEHIPRYLQGL